MTTFQVLDNHRNVVATLPEHPTFARYRAPCSLVYVCLVTGVNQSKWYILSDLREVPPMFDSGLLYDQPQPCRAITIWRPTVVLTPALAANVTHAIGVQIQVAA